MTSYRFFFKMAARPAAILYLIGIMLDHPQSATAGLRLFLKFSLDRIYNFGDRLLRICDLYIFCFLAWNCLFTPILGFLRAYFPKITSPIALNYKMHFITRKHVVWAIKRENRFSGSTWARSGEKKDRTGQPKKFTKWSPIWEKAPTVLIRTKICMLDSYPT